MYTDGRARTHTCTEHSQQCPSRTTVARDRYNQTRRTSPARTRLCHKTTRYYVHTLKRRVHATGLCSTPYSTIALKYNSIYTVVWVVRNCFCYSIWYNGVTAEPVSRDQIFRRERGQGNINFPCPADHVQDWQPYLVDPYSCFMCDYTYIHTTAL